MCLDLLFNIFLLISVWCIDLLKLTIKSFIIMMNLIYLLAFFVETNN